MDGGAAAGPPRLDDGPLFGRAGAGAAGAQAALTQRDRSLLAVSAVIAMNRPDQLRAQLVEARGQGVTEQELVEAVHCLAMHVGWPHAMRVTALSVIEEVFFPSF